MTMTSIWNVLRGIKTLIQTAIDAAGARGLTDKLVQDTILWIRVAATKFADSAEKREWVVGILVNKGVPESIARITVELAYQIFKKDHASAPA